MLKFGAFLCFWWFKVSAIILSVEHNYDKSSSVWCSCHRRCVYFDSQLCHIHWCDVHRLLIPINSFRPTFLLSPLDAPITQWHATDIQTYQLFQLNLSILRRFCVGWCTRVDGQCDSWFSNWSLRVSDRFKSNECPQNCTKFTFMSVDSPLALLLRLFPICMFTLFVISNPLNNSTLC